MKKLFLLAAIAAAQGVCAQSDSTGNALDEVVVTATKSPKKLSETGKVLTVITKAQIERSGGKDFAQLITEQTGIIVNGAVSNAGKDKSLFLRGATDKYTLILLDDIPLNEPAGVGGSFDLRLLSLDNIERIEILKGSQSTLYGSNAVAGVINIISKKPATAKPQFNALATYGSFNTFKGNANISQKAKVLEYDLNYTYYNTDGISEAKDTTGKANFDKDGFTQHAVQAVVGINITKQLKISPYYRFTQFTGGYDADAFTDAPNNYNASLVNSGLDGRYNYAKGTVHVNYGYDFTKRLYAGQYGDFTMKGKFHHAELFVNHTFSKALQMVAGANLQVYRIDAPDTVNSIVSPFVSLFLHSNNGWNIELGGRYNQHNKYGGNATYSFNPSYLINEKIKLFANVTSGFRAPSIGELFGPYGANPDLKPEKSNTQEAGVQAVIANKKITATITGFNRTITDVIVYNTNYTYENRDKQHDFGAELELSITPVEQLNIKASYAYIDGKITQALQGKDTSYYNLLRRPKHSVNLYAGYQVSKQLFISASTQVIGKRTDNYFDPNTFVATQVDLSAYALVNMYAEYRFLKSRLNVFVDAKNLFDKTNFYEVYGYGVQGINVTGGVRLRL
ncbi:TonB-dependent receptor [Panacibacter sp. DH6]|uniref:TonB-dependent receptor n=1 Tax=Panacibacter microcysteis TaxID=2793269 RepID=A0A931E6P0_9BACT|nr:TonB-dependent receptor [Panacibacter microcysteis]MBG9376265.1 TonB-dependent receptor [Panacibacter microcysteis]